MVRFNHSLTLRQVFLKIKKYKIQIQKYKTLKEIAKLLRLLGVRVGITLG